jgi:hypothetical protein
MVYKVNQAIIMKLRFLTEDKGVSVKAQIHKSGRLGFSLQAIRRFNFDVSKGMAFAVEENAQDNNTFYGVITPSNAPNTIKFTKLGQYYAIDSPSTFNKLGFDYRNEACIFAIEVVDYEGANVLKFTRREARGNKSK